MRKQLSENGGAQGRASIVMWWQGEAGGAARPKKLDNGGRYSTHRAGRGPSHPRPLPHASRDNKTSCNCYRIGKKTRRRRERRLLLGHSHSTPAPAAANKHRCPCRSRLLGLLCACQPRPSSSPPGGANRRAEVRLPGTPSRSSVHSSPSGPRQRPGLLGLERQAPDSLGILHIPQPLVQPHHRRLCGEGGMG